MSTFWKNKFDYEVFLLHQQIALGNDFAAYWQARYVFRCIALAYGAIPFHRCCKPVLWKIVRDDDDCPQRKYEPFCPEHMKAAAKQQDT